MVVVLIFEPVARLAMIREGAVGDRLGFAPRGRHWPSAGALPPSYTSSDHLPTSYDISEPDFQPLIQITVIAKLYGNRGSGGGCGNGCADQ